MRHRLAHDEGGSIVVALLVAIVVGGLVTTITARAVTGQRSVSFDRDFTAVVHGAEAGVSEALAQLKDADEAWRTGFVPAQVNAPGEIDGITYDWSAAKTGARTWEITSTGTRGDVSRTLVVTIEDRPRFSAGLFGDVLLDFAGSNIVDSYDGTDWCTGNGAVGTNGVAEFQGVAPSSVCDSAGPSGSHAPRPNGRTVDLVVLYDWADNPGDPDPPHDPRCDHHGGRGGTNNCHAGTGSYSQFSSPMLVDDERKPDIEFIEEALDDCSVIYPTWYTSLPPMPGVSSGELPPGDWCVEKLIFDVDTELEDPSETTRIYVSGEISVSGPHLRINCPSGDCVAGSTHPVTDNLQIYSSGTGVVEVRPHLTVAAGIYAPRSNCKGGPNAQAEFFGSLICSEVDNVGGWKLHYDDRLRDIGSGIFEIAVWQENP